MVGMALQMFGTFEAKINLQQLSKETRQLFNLICISATFEKKLSKFVFHLAEGKKYTEANIEELLNLRFIYEEKNRKCFEPVFSLLELEDDELLIYVNNEIYFENYISSLVKGNGNILGQPVLLKGKYSLRLFELFAKHDFKPFEIDFDRFKAFMGFSKTYKSHMILQYLATAEEELKKESIFETISHEEIRRDGNSTRKGKLLALSFEGTRFEI